MENLVRHCLIACIVSFVLFASGDEDVQLREDTKQDAWGRRLLGHNKNAAETEIVKETTAKPNKANRLHSAMADKVKAFAKFAARKMVAAHQNKSGNKSSKKGARAGSAAKMKRKAAVMKKDAGLKTALHK